MKNLKNKKTLVKLSILILAVVALCYALRVIVPWLVDVWYENLFWEECVKQDEQIPPNTELLISACTDPKVRGVPGGEVLFVHEKKTGEIYLLDLRTGEKKQVPNDPLLVQHGIFLSSELVWLVGYLSPDSNTKGYRPHYILDLTNGQRYELVDLRFKFPVRLVKNGELIPEVIPYFTGAEKVFVHYSSLQLIALSPDFRQQHERNAIFPLSYFSVEKTDTEYVELIERLMGGLKINYEIIDFSLRYTDVPSPTGKYIANSDGIFLSGADSPLISGEYTRGNYGDRGGSFISWYYDESGFVYTQGEYYYYQDSLLGSHFLLPRPVLKLNLPEK